MEITLADFTLWVVVGSFVLVPLMSLVSRAMQARTERRAREDVVICRLCLHAFEEKSHVNLVNCPECGAANEKGRARWPE